MTLFKKQFCLDGQERKAYLCENLDNKQLYFKKDYEMAGYSFLNFETFKDLLDYLDKKYPEEPQFIIAGDNVYYPASIGDRNLEYFATIEE